MVTLAGYAQHRRDVRARAATTGERRCAAGSTTPPPLRPAPALVCVSAPGLRRRPCGAAVGGPAAPHCSREMRLS